MTLTEMTLTALLAFSAPLPGFAAAPDYTLSVAQKGDQLIVSALPPLGHHFNVDAPASAQTGGPEGTQTASEASPIKPTTKIPSLMTFAFMAPQTALPQDYTIQLYVCDDALTFCEKKSEHLQWPSVEVRPTASSSTQPQSMKPLEKAAGADEVAALFKLARSKHLPLMVDFYGVWCPPCNMLNENVFSKSAFTRAARDFVQVKIDVDTPQAWGYTARYKVTGYPTVLFLTPDGEEISRILGYRPLTPFIRSMKEAYLSRDPKTLAMLAKKAQTGDLAASDQLGLIELGKGNFEASVQLLEPTKLHREKLWDARIGLAARMAAEKGGEDPKKILTATRRQAIEEFPLSPDSIERRTDLAESLQSEGKKADALAVYQGAAAATKKILASSPEEITEMVSSYDTSIADLWAQLAEIDEAMDDLPSAKIAYASAAQEFKKELVTPNDRGVNLELAANLWRSGDDSQARAIYTRMQKAYPSDFTFYNNQARMELALGNAAEALRLSLKARELSYGSNRLEVSLVLAKSFKALKKLSEARAAIDDAVNEVPRDVPEEIRKSKSVRYYRSLQRLKDYEKKELS